MIPIPFEGKSGFNLLGLTHPSLKSYRPRPPLYVRDLLCLLVCCVFVLLTLYGLSFFFPFSSSYSACCRLPTYNTQTCLWFVLFTPNTRACLWFVFFRETATPAAVVRDGGHRSWRPSRDHHRLGQGGELWLCLTCFSYDIYVYHFLFFVFFSVDCSSTTD